MADGMLVEVTVTNRQSHATQAQAIGDGTVTVEDPTQFAETGGSLDIAGVGYDYTAADPDTGIITLATNLTAAVVEFDPVSVVAGGQVAQDFNAIVDFGEGANVTVEIPYALRSQLSEKAYDPPLPVKVSDDLTTLLGVDGQQPGDMQITDDSGNVIWSGLNGPIQPVSETWYTVGFAYPQHSTNLLISKTITVPTGYTRMAYFAVGSVLIYSHAGHTDTSQVLVTIGSDTSLNFGGQGDDGDLVQSSAFMSGVLTGLTGGSTVTAQVHGGGSNYDWGTDASNSVVINLLAMFLR